MAETGFSDKEIILLDGGLGTHLRALGAEFKGDPLWASRAVISSPELVRRAHFDFFKAGADVAITATYQASLSGFAHMGLPPSKAAEYVQLAIILADEARQLVASGALPAGSVDEEKENLAHSGPEGRSTSCAGACELCEAESDRFSDERVSEQKLRKRKVIVSNGSYGASLGGGAEYRGNYGVSEAALKDYHRWRLQAAMQVEHLIGGVVFETVPESCEAKAIVSLLREFPAFRGRSWLAFTCKSGTELASGEDFRSVVADVLREDAPHSSISGIGVNCSPTSATIPLLCTPPLLDAVAPALEKTRDPRSCHVLCYPNNEPRHHHEGETAAGIQDLVERSPCLCAAAAKPCDGQTHSLGPTSRCPHHLAETVHHPLARRVPAWLEGGVTAVGGCCGTSPEDLRAIHAVLQRLGAR